ncbi:MAG TPA: methyltransferase [Lacipirellula sp.]
MPPERPNLPEVGSRASLPIRPAEQRALALAADFPGESILCTTAGRAQAAWRLAQQRPAGRVSCWFLDDYQRQLAASAYDGAATNLSLICAADPPEDAIDLAVIPLSMHGEGELARDILQSACIRLAIGGTLVAAVDNPRDKWLREQVEELFGKATVEAFGDATVYAARKTAEPRKKRDFRCEFAFRDCGQLIRAVSRPGVFAHRRADPGARQLLAAAELTAGMRVLDIGCGAGTVALALAGRNPSVQVHAVDSNARAVECTLAGAALNSLANVTAELNATGEYRDAGTYDLALANPPYYADFRIAKLFLSAAHRSLKPGGRVIVVAKRKEWYEEFMLPRWNNVEHWPSKRYHVITATRP